MDAGDGRNSMATEPQSGGLIDFRQIFVWIIIWLVGFLVGRLTR
jgi:hypothetical protein